MSYTKHPVYLTNLSVMDNAVELPTSFRLFQYGDNNSTKGVLKFDELSAEKVISSYSQYGNDLSIDYEHQAIKSKTNGPVPAAGWFKLKIENDINGKPELWADGVEWNNKAKELLTNREYRYYSPAFFTDENDRIIEIINCALTNQPALMNLDPLVASKGVDIMEEDMNKLEAVLTLLQEMNKKLDNLLGEEKSEVELEKCEVEEKDNEVELMKSEVETLSKKLNDAEDEALKASLIAHGISVTNEKRLNDISILVKLHRGDKTITTAVDEFAKENVDLFTKVEQPKTATINTSKEALKALSKPVVKNEVDSNQVKRSFNERRQLNLKK